ncbi:MAG TPA: hypothetical protein VGW40_05270 [Allosphingosinicella sp.]|nr:hypothetical protein [Allosphingosinicella sp.]
MVFALFLSAPIALIGALILSVVAHRWSLVPRGLPGLLTLCLLTAVIMGSLATILTFRLFAVHGARAQQRMLGEQAAGVLQLRHYEDSEFPDPGQEWHYALDPDTAARLRRRCAPGPRPGECRIYLREGPQGLAFVTLAGDRLIVADLSL